MNNRGLILWYATKPDIAALFRHQGIGGHTPGRLKGLVQLSLQLESSFSKCRLATMYESTLILETPTFREITQRPAFQRLCSTMCRYTNGKEAEE